jgi:GTPase SAR1 family protein
MNAHQESPQYSIFKERQANLLRLIQQQQIIARELCLKNWEDTLEKLKLRVQNENFKVFVVGEFRRGKSTLINALLGANILPAYAVPTTAIINEVKWGDSPRAVLHYKSRAGETQQTQEIPVEKLSEYIVIKGGTDQSQAFSESPYEKAEIFWPLPLCKNGVEIIDSPGLNEHEIRQKVTMEYLSNVDVILFVSVCDILCSKSELEVIDHTLRGMGHEDIFFPCNKINVIDDEEKDVVKQRAISVFAPRTKGGEARVFFLDAKGALKGRLKGNKAEVEASDLPHLEAELEKFLATERGRLKLILPAKELKQSIQAARQTIPERAAMLITDIETLKQRYAEVQEPLQQLEILSGQIVAKVSNFRADIQLIVSEKARYFYRSIVDEKLEKHENKIYKWVTEYQIKNPVQIKEIFGISAAIERVVKEITEEIAFQLEGELNTWQKSVLEPYLNTRFDELKTDLDARATQFMSQLDDLRFKIAGTSLTGQEVIKQASALERILSVVGALIFGNMVTATMGGVFGFKAMILSLLQQLTLGLITIAFVGSNPLVLVPVMLGGGLLEALIRAKGLNPEIKKQIQRKYTGHFRQVIPERVNEIAKAVDDKLLQLQNALKQGMEKEINNLKDQVNSIMQEKQKGQVNVDDKLRQLQALERTLNDIDARLDDLIAQIAIQ